MRLSWLRWIGLLLVVLGGLLYYFGTQRPVAVSGAGCRVEVLLPAAAGDPSPASTADYRRVHDSCTGELLYEGPLDAAQHYQSLTEHALPLWVFIASGLAAATGGVALFIVGNRSVPAPGRRRLFTVSSAFRALAGGFAAVVLYVIAAMWIHSVLYGSGYLGYTDDFLVYFQALPATALVGAAFGLAYRPGRSPRRATPDPAAPTTARAPTPAEDSLK